LALIHPHPTLYVEFLIGEFSDIESAKQPCQK